MYAPPDPATHRFVWELLKSGLVLIDTLSILLESLEEKDPWPGRDTGEVLIEAVAGSVQPALAGLPRDEVEAAADLIVAVRDRFMADLRLGAEIGRRREKGHRVE